MQGVPGILITGLNLHHSFAYTEGEEFVSFLKDCSFILSNKWSKSMRYTYVMYLEAENSAS